MWRDFCEPTQVVCFDGNTFYRLLQVTCDNRKRSCKDTNFSIFTSGLQPFGRPQWKTGDVGMSSQNVLQSISDNFLSCGTILANKGRGFGGMYLMGCTMADVSDRKFGLRTRWKKS